MNLSDRKKRILRAVVDESIKTSEPVSSKDIQEKYMSELSPATIRNELMTLEELGYLSQPHTSAGRVPTANGYKMYVDELMTVKKLSKREADNIKMSFNEQLFNLDDVLKKAAKAISDATNYASVVCYGIGDEAEIEKVMLVRLTEIQTLVVVVTDLGLIKGETNRINASEDELRQASNILSSVLKGKSLNEIEDCYENAQSELVRYKQIFDLIIHIITERDSDHEHNMAVSGKDKLLNYPEYQDFGKLKNTFSLLERKEELYPLLTEGNDLEISVKVGGDDKLGVTDCSIVTATYKSKGKTIGSANVVGPVRMDYGKVVSILKNVTEILENNIFGKEKDDE